MKITSFKIYKYSLPLNEAMYVRGLHISSREGLLIQLTSDDGTYGYGEIAPLLSLNEESLPFALNQTQQLKSNLLERPVPAGIEKLDGSFESWLGGLNLAPSVRFGVEAAVLTLIAQKQHKFLSALLFDTSHSLIRLNGLLYGTKEEVIAQTKKLLKEGFLSLKLKVGGDIKEDIEKVRAVNALVEGHALLHLDANQSWTLNEAVEFGNEIGCDAIDYIEEPFKDPSLIPDFFMKTTIPVALDESLKNLAFDELKSIEGVDFLIIKPTVLGSIEKIWQLIQNARRLAINTVISSSYESEVGIMILANIAGANARDDAAGLDTLKWFKNGVFRKGNVIENGRINLKKFNDLTALIDFDLITEVYHGRN